MRSCTRTQVQTGVTEQLDGDRSELDGSEEEVKVHLWAHSSLRTNRDTYVFEVLTIIDYILLHILPVWIAVWVTIQPLEGVGTLLLHFCPVTFSSLLITIRPFCLRPATCLEFQTNHISTDTGSSLPKKKLRAFFFVAFFWSGFTAQHCPRWFLLLKLPGYIQALKNDQKTPSVSVCVTVVEPK